LEADGTANIARSALVGSSSRSAIPWRLIAAGGGLLAAATLGTYLYVSHSTAPGEGTQADAGLPVASGAASSTAPSGSARPDSVVSIESLPVDNQREPGRSNEPVRRWSGRREKSFDELVNEGAAAARKGGIAKAENTASPTADPAPPAAGIDQAAARRALANAAAAARSCKGQGEPPSPHGQAVVTFSPSGGVTAVSISQSFMGTPIGSCVISHYRNVRVPPFEGEPTTLNSTFEIPE
jgi:hypothetical protein